MSSAISFPPPGFSSGRSSGWGSARWQPPGATRTDQLLKALERTRTSDINLQVTTDEGDTVTITLHSELDQLAVSYRSKSKGPEGREALKLRLDSAESTQELSIQVEGALNEDELADVNALIDRVKLHVQDFLANGGSLEGDSLADVNADGSLDTLAGFRLEESSSDTVNALVLRMREWQAPAPPAAPLPAPAPGLADGKLATIVPLPAGRPADESAAAAPVADPTAAATTLLDRASAALDAVSKLLAAWKEQLEPGTPPSPFAPEPAATA